MSFVGNIPLLHRRLFVVGTLILVAIIAKYRLGRFPYTGTWVGYDGGKDGNFRRTSVSFNADNSCSWLTDSFRKNRWRSSSYDCSYKMRGDTALVELRVYDNQNYEGKWRVATTAKEKQQAPLILISFPAEVTPVDDGKKLKIESHKTVFKYQSYDTTWSSSSEIKMELLKIDVK